jgi:hypothetical protein
MRCILVNCAKLKADTCCCHCRKGISDSYVREIGTSRIFCDHACYSSAVRAPIVTLEYCTLPLNSWRLGS